MSDESKIWENFSSREFKKDLVPLPPQRLELPQKSSHFAIEIGAGKGEHALSYARENPESFLLAIERTQEKSKRMQFLHEQSQLGNLITLRADAINIISHYIQEESVDEYFILYPNPHPLRARWPRHNFTSWMIKTMRPGAKLTLATNIFDYYEEAHKLYHDYWGLEVDFSGEIQKTIKKPRTPFERKYLEREEKLYELILKKPKHP